MGLFNILIGSQLSTKKYPKSSFFGSSILCCWLLLALNSLAAQDYSHDFDRYIKLSEKGEKEKALSLVRSVVSPHITDPTDALDMARERYRKGEYAFSFLLYEYYLNFHEQIHTVQLEYASCLYQQLKLNATIQELQDYLRYDSTVLAYEMLGNAYLWQLDYRSAMTIFEKLLRLDAQNAVATRGLAGIDAILSPYLNANYAFSDDDQPLISHQLRSGYKQYINGLWAPFAEIAYGAFRSDINTSQLNSDFYHFEAGNVFHWHEAGTKLSVRGGIYDQTQTKEGFSYGLQLSKSLPLDMEAHLQWQGLPYFTTVASLEEQVFLEELSVRLTKPYMSTFNGEFSVAYKKFMDGNTGWNAYSYMMVTIIQNDRWLCKTGYGFNYDDTEESRYRSVLSLEEIVNSGELNDIPARYDPYFTPQEQITHSLLLNLHWSIARNWEIFTTVNWGVYARSRIPYLFLSENDAGELAIERDYEWIGQNVRDIRAGIDFNPTQSIMLRLEGQYQDLFFYKRFGLNSKITLRL